MSLRVRCPCCDAAERHGVFTLRVLGKHDADYVECDRCRSLYVTDPHWLAEAYANNDRDVNDTGRFGRVDGVAAVMFEMRRQRRISECGRWLDYGAGDGLLADKLRDAVGYDAVSYDPYVEEFAARPGGTFVGASLIEVLQHLVEPYNVLTELCQVTDVMLVSTEIYDGHGSDWPYLATDWGQHVTFPSLDGLRALADRAGFLLDDELRTRDGLPIYVLRRIASSLRRTASRTVTLVNHFHAGDVLMARCIIEDIAAANPDIDIELECKDPYRYLWTDLGFPVNTGRPDTSRINLHFAHFPDTMRLGLTYDNHVDTFNRQAAEHGLCAVVPTAARRILTLPRPDIGQVRSPAVLLENGPVLSGQVVHELNPVLIELSKRFGHVSFYLTHAPARIARANLVDVSRWDLLQLSVLSEKCQLLVCRLSAVMVASFTRANHGRKRIVYGRPLGCAIWDEVGVVYVDRFEDLCREIREETSRGHD